MPDFSIVNINEIHRESIKKFACGDSDINRFLKRDSLNDQNNNHSVTYLLINNKNHDIIAYVSLAMGSLELHLHDKYEETPGILLARLGRNIKYKNMEYGKDLVYFALALAKNLQEKIGCRIVFCHAYEGKENFYQDIGFKIFGDPEKEIDGDKNTIPLFYDLK